jgi:hypothetical protein
MPSFRSIAVFVARLAMTLVAVFLTFSSASIAQDSYEKIYSEKYQLAVKCSDDAFLPLIKPNSQETAKTIARTAFFVCSKHWEASAQAFILSKLNNESQNSEKDVIETMQEIYVDRAERIIIWLRSK